MQANPDLFGDLTAATLNPDELAETVWRLYTERTEAEAVVNALAARLRAESLTAPVARIVRPGRR